MFQEIQPRVATLTADGTRTLWLTGHSLGGALATLCAQMFNEVQGVYVFGSPRVGDTAFAAAYARPLWRFCNDGDVVVTVPLNGVPLLPFLPSFLPKYEHAGKSVWFDAAQSPSHRDSPYMLLTTLLPQSALDHAPVAYSVLTWNQIP